MSSNQTYGNVQAMLNYTLPSPNRDSLYSYVLRPDPPKSWTNVVPDPCIVRIQDVRGRENEFSLDRSGFEFLRHCSVVTDLFDERMVKELYYPEVQQLVRKHIGAGLVIFADHTLRRSQCGRQSDFAHVSGPHSVHGDRTYDAAIALARQIVGNKSERLLKGRHRLINVWHPIGGPVYDQPLALSDWRTITPQRDLIPLCVKYAGRNIETLAAVYDTKHELYYLKEQTPEEVTLFKCFDSRTDGVARLSLHSAFHDPESSPDCVPGKSIEVRALVFDLK